MALKLPKRRRLGTAWRRWPSRRALRRRKTNRCGHPVPWPAPARATCRNRAQRDARTGQFLLRGRGRHGVGGSDFTGRSSGIHHFCQAEIEDFGMTALGHEDVRGLDVAVDDALGVSGVERVGNLDAQVRIESMSMGRPPMRRFSVRPSSNSMAMKDRRLRCSRRRRWCRCWDGSGRTPPAPRAGNVPGPARLAPPRQAET